MSKIYLTSDWHFNHDKDFIWKARGFTSVDEMNTEIIKRHNSIVTNNDIVYVLGDCIMGDLNAGLKMLIKMKGQKYLAFGNHDTNARLKAFKDNNIFKDIQMGYRIIVGKKKTAILTHYPTVTANGEDTRTINLYGHTHQEDNFFENKPYMYHVGVDSHSCYPVNIDDILEEIKNKKGEL